MVGEGYWGRSNGLYCTDPKSSWQVSLKSLWVVGGVRWSAEGFVGGMGWSVCPSPWLPHVNLRGLSRRCHWCDDLWYDVIWSGGESVCCSTLNQGRESFWGRVYLSLRQEVQCWASQNRSSVMVMEWKLESLSTTSPWMGHCGGGCWATFAFWEQCLLGPMHIINSWCKSLSDKCKKVPLNMALQGSCSRKMPTCS